MDTKSKNELYSIKIELNFIISELESISKGIRKDFQNIGNDKCAASIDSVLDNYYIVKSKLDNIDTKTLTQEFLDALSQGFSYLY